MKGKPGKFDLALANGMALLLALGMLFFCLGKKDLHLTTLLSAVSGIRFYFGFGLALLVVLGNRWWPSVTIGTAALCLVKGNDLKTAIGIAAGNTLGIILSTFLLRQRGLKRNAFDRFQTILWFLVIVAGGALLCVSIESVILFAGKAISDRGFVEGLFLLWLSASTGAALLTPALLIWVNNPPIYWKQRSIWEGLALIGSLIACGLPIFLGMTPIHALEQSEWVIILPFFWAAIRFGHHGAVTAVILIFIMAQLGVRTGSGPFIVNSQMETELFSQLFIGTISILGLVMLALLAEFKKAEDALQTREERFRMMFESMLQGVAVHDADGRIISLNSAAANIFGRTPQELVGQTSGTWLQNAIRSNNTSFPDDEDPVTETRKTGRKVQNILMGVTNAQQGQLHWLVINSVPFFHSGEPQPHEIFLFFDDVTESRKLTEAIRSSEQRYRGLAESIPDAMFILNAQSVYQYVNPTAAAWLGLPHQKIIGRNRLDFFPEPIVHQQEKIFKQILQTGQMAVRQWCLPYQNTEKWVETRFIPLLKGTDGENYIIGISRDLTEQRKLQKQVLEISMEERQRIGYDLHDGLGQHLAGVAFMIKALEKDIALASPKLANDVAKIVGLINQGVSQTRNLARLLAPVDVSSSGLQPALKKLLAETEKLYRIESVMTGNLDDTLFEAEFSMALYRITQEAIHNAIRHGNPSRITLNLLQQDNEICLSVTDNGEGFSPDENSQDGMGIRIMQYRATAIGGSVTISSSSEKGTKLECRIPLN